ncbi:MAG: hypothetical protein HC879_01165 [Leptolyngbyaceae cyanobacterium SL_5_9]|nr:hypothetical protein [Leptolyngbyaceae cyanobacterium SL_5_9]NJO74961.1 hypothetical protein [Leptolyngbyaceae cyanobacterium RM1_406_9]
MVDRLLSGKLDQQAVSGGFAKPATNPTGSPLKRWEPREFPSTVRVEFSKTGGYVARFATLPNSQGFSVLRTNPERYQKCAKIV